MKRKFITGMLVVIISLVYVFSFGVNAEVTKYESPVTNWGGIWHAYGFSGSAIVSVDAGTGDNTIGGILGYVYAPSGNIGYYQFTSEFDIETPGVAMFLRGVWANTAEAFSVVANYFNGIYVIPKADSIEVVFGTGTSNVVHSFPVPAGYSIENVVKITVKDNSDAIFIYANNSLVCAISLGGSKTVDSAEYYGSVTLINPAGDVVATVNDALVAKTGNFVGYASNIDEARVKVKSISLHSETFEDKIPSAPETENPETSDTFVLGFFFIALTLPINLLKRRFSV